MKKNPWMKQVKCNIIEMMVEKPSHTSPEPIILSGRNSLAVKTQRLLKWYSLGEIWHPPDDLDYYTQGCCQVFGFKS